MILIDNFSQVIAQIESERGIEKHMIVDAIKKALISATKKKYSNELEVQVDIDSDTGESRLWVEKTVVADYIDDESRENQILYADAQEISKDAENGDILEFDLDVSDFGRIATQTAKQVILQCIREAEKDLVMNEFSDKIGQIVTGTVQNIEGNTYLINLGKIESFLPPREQVFGEKFNVKDKIKVYIVDIQKSTKGPVVKISRSHSGLIRELFKLEIPEIQDNIIEIKSISRSSGKRTKIAVHSNNSNISAVGTCVGHMGGRIQSILREINNEKIDILEWDESPEVFIANSLKPANISSVTIKDHDLKEATVIVPDDQLSLAIGKTGLNVRLAVKLTGWKLDILSENDHKQSSSQQSLEEKLKIAQKPKEEDSPKDDSSSEPVAEEDATKDNSSEPVTEVDATKDDSNTQPSLTQDELEAEIIKESLSSES